MLWSIWISFAYFQELCILKRGLLVFSNLWCSGHLHFPICKCGTAPSLRWLFFLCLPELSLFWASGIKSPSSKWIEQTLVSLERTKSFLWIAHSHCFLLAWALGILNHLNPLGVGKLSYPQWQLTTVHLGMMKLWGRKIVIWNRWNKFQISQ